MLDGGADPNATDALGTHVLTLAALRSDRWLALQACAAVVLLSGTQVLQLAAPAAWGARLWVWAALRTLGECLDRSDLSGSMWGCCQPVLQSLI